MLETLNALIWMGVGAGLYAMWWRGSHVVIGVVTSVPFDFNRAIGMTLF